MTHTALARKYRPLHFKDLMAQNHVATGLAGAVAKDRVAHGYLLTGPRGTGKTTAARILAMALNCEKRDRDAGEGEPCGECDSCKRVWAGSANLDVVEIDAASNRGVDDARELRERAMYAASAEGRYKVYIVDEAHMLTREAWNALLKILEEPPPGVVFVFATTEPQKIANTTTAVLSRLQRFDFRRIGPQAIVDRLREVVEAEGIGVDEDALTLIGRVANGGMRDALSILDQVVVFSDGSITAEAVREALGLIDDELYGEVLDVVAGRRPEEVFPLVARLMDRGADLIEFVGGLGEVLRALMVRKLGGTPTGLTEGLRLAIEKVEGDFSEGDVLRMLKLLESSDGAIRRSPNARLHVETLLLQWAFLDRTVEISEILEALKGGGEVGKTERPSRTPPSEPSHEPRPSRPPRPRPEKEASAVSAESEAPPPPPSPGRALEPTIQNIKAGWSVIVDSVGRKKPLLREVLAVVEPVGVDKSEVSLRFSGGEHELEGLNRNRGIVGEAISGYFDRRFTVSFIGESSQEAPVEPKRQTLESDREARLKGYRAKDPALDSAADALDLEIIE
ncbi:MAG: DNA polymerase III subunit gamma/tau [Gemmatimonadota bacterium]|nr:DNA polymerase III subunit gamma/tau [Gemmatimonadota bacterium]